MKVVGAGLGAEPGRIERPRKAPAPEEASREDREPAPAKAGGAGPTPAPGLGLGAGGWHRLPKATGVQGRGKAWG